MPFRLQLVPQEGSLLDKRRSSCMTVAARREMRLAIQNAQESPSRGSRSSSRRRSSTKSSHLTSIFSMRKSRTSPSGSVSSPSGRASSWSLRKSSYKYEDDEENEEDEEQEDANAPAAVEAPARSVSSDMKAARMSFLKRASSSLSLRFSSRVSAAEPASEPEAKPAQWNGMKVASLVSIFTKRLRAKQQEKVKTDMRTSKKYLKLLETLWEAAVFEQKTKGTWTLKGYMDYHLSLYFYLNESTQH